MRDYIQVVTTTETKDDARRVARALVESRLAACVQILGPIVSTYWWKGEIAEAEEYMCVVKTRQDLFTSVEAAIKTVHPYDVPEILSMPVGASSQTYLDWLNGELISHRNETG